LLILLAQSQWSYYLPCATECNRESGDSIACPCGVCSLGAKRDIHQISTKQSLCTNCHQSLEGKEGGAVIENSTGLSDGG
jgi:hypothetical protein